MTILSQTAYPLGMPPHGRSKLGIPKSIPIVRYDRLRYEMSAACYVVSHFMKCESLNIVIVVLGIRDRIMCFRLYCIIVYDNALFQIML